MVVLDSHHHNFLPLPQKLLDLPQIVLEPAPREPVAGRYLARQPLKVIADIETEVPYPCVQLL
jgi:hypothetical protein